MPLHFNAPAAHEVNYCFPEPLSVFKCMIAAFQLCELSVSLWCSTPDSSSSKCSNKAVCLLSQPLACCSQLDPIFDLILYVANRMCIASHTSLYLCGVKAWLRKTYFLYCASVIPSSWISIWKKEIFFSLRACLLRKYFLLFKYILFYYFHELKICFGRVKKTAVYEETPKPLCLASSHKSRWFILWYSMLLTVRLTTAINSPLICSSMHCLQACGSYMHALMKHSYRPSSGHTLTLFKSSPHACAKGSGPLECKVLFWPVSSSWAWSANLSFSEDIFLGQFDIRTGVSPPPRACCSQQVAGFQMCQPIFINISNLLVLSGSTTECVATVIVDFPFVECLYFYCSLSVL